MHVTAGGRKHRQVAHVRSRATRWRRTNKGWSRDTTWSFNRHDFGAAFGLSLMSSSSSSSVSLFDVGEMSSSSVSNSTSRSVDLSLLVANEEDNQSTQSTMFGHGKTTHLRQMKSMGQQAFFEKIGTHLVYLSPFQSWHGIRRHELVA